MWRTGRKVGRTMQEDRGPAVEWRGEELQVLTVRIHRDPGREYALWAEIGELPGCLASGRGLNELQEALTEAVSQYLSGPGREVRVHLEVTSQQVRATYVT
jgi:predicted RNase H-like HicB family nuclease